jgi:large subunit ribosomal protein L20
MTKVKHAPSSRKHRKKALKAAKGYFGSKSRLYRIAKEAGRKSLIYQYVGRKRKKRDYRSLWITRISAACRAEGTTYNKLISGLKRANVLLDRKALADIAVNDSAGFKFLLKKASI